MKLFIISILLIFCLVFALSVFVITKMKGTKLYFFVKKHIITDEDLEKFS